MPTIIALDVSLSMAYKVSGYESSEKFSRLQLAAHAVNILLDYLTLHSKLEYVAIVRFIWRMSFVRINGTLQYNLI